MPDWRGGGGLAEVMRQIGTPAAVLAKPGDVAHKAAKDHTGLVIDVEPRARTGAPSTRRSRPSTATRSAATTRADRSALNENQASVYDSYFSPDPKRAPADRPIVF